MATMRRLRSSFSRPSAGDVGVSNLEKVASLPVQGGEQGDVSGASAVHAAALGLPARVSWLQRLINCCEVPFLKQLSRVEEELVCMASVKRAGSGSGRSFT